MAQVGHGEDAFFWTDQYDENGQTCSSSNEKDVLGYDKRFCRMVNGMGIVVGQYGRILRTEDGGTSWESVPSPTSAHLRGISMNEENTRSGSLYSDQVGRRCVWARIHVDTEGAGGVLCV
jgi:photosystem II stability/assembly factor-like uncharacterized protein